ncbi:MAG: hypothetical protein LC624_02285 [Halobacteriales archaeon]|nr:hypothetical protein [Halobacteriales archaeon]
MPRPLALLLSLALLAPAALALAPLGPSHAEELRAQARGLAERYAPPGSGKLVDDARFAWSHGSDAALARAAPLPQLLAPGLAEAVVDAYAAYGWPSVSDAQLHAMQAQAARLDPRLAGSAALLLEDLAAHVPIQQAVLARSLHAGTVEASPADASLLAGSALRIADGVDAVAQALRAPGLGPSRSDGAFAFRDPYDLVLIGDAGANTYTGNTLGLPLVNPRANLLTIDLGGDDVYTGTAGGGYPTSPCYYYTDSVDPLGNPHHETNYVLPDPADPRLGMCGDGISAGVAIDRAGDDVYDHEGTFGPWEHQAVQGSGQFFGVGMLLDLQGNDRYLAVSHEAGLAYHAAQGSGGTTGFYAFGLLVDEGGSDAYEDVMTTVAHEGSANYSQQRAQAGGIGMLFDLGREADTYRIEVSGPANVWQSAQASIGDLFDMGGDDTYTAVLRSGPLSVQAVQAEDGLLYEAGGDDVYDAFAWCNGGCTPFGAWQNVQGSAEAGGSGELVDLAGNDRYLAVSNAEQHVQSAAIGAPTLLLDLAGDDLYAAEQWDDIQYAQGSGKGTQSLFVDAAGDDAYLAVKHGDGEQWAQGGSGSSPGVYGGNGTLFAMLFDLGGSDAYTAVTDPGASVLLRTQGAGIRGLGVLVDCGAGDTYSNPAAAEGTYWRQFDGGFGWDCDGFPAGGYIPLPPMP